MSKPKIRFKGYEEDWEQRKFEDVGSVAMCKRIFKEQTSDEGEVPFYKIGTFGSEPDAFISRELFNEYKTKYQYPNKGDILISASGSIGRTVEFTGRDEYFQDSNIVWLKHGNEIDNSFLKVLYSVIEWSCEGSTIKRLYNDNFLKTEFMLPKIDEQIKIGNYFSNLDHLITLHQRKCEETKKLKKYMLQKMFPQNGKRVPEIRFAGFTDDWEQRKLGDVTELKSASRVHKGEWTDSGVPFFRSSDVMAAINGTTNEKAYISEELYEKLSNASGKLEEGDVLVTGGGSVGNPYIVPNNEPLYTKDADLLWIKNQGRFYPYFLYEYFFSPTFRIYLSNISHVGTIAHYTITQLSETPISLPDIEEQIKVGEYFESLDRLITLHQRKYEELQKIKKFMLQNMFI